MSKPGEIAVSYVVPAHNSETLIGPTWLDLRTRFNGGVAEVLMVENGSTDETWAVMQEIAASLEPDDPDLQILRSAKGLGNAMRQGVLASRGDVVVLTADDLPFGFTDWDAYSSLADAPSVVIGSKAHPDSVLTREAGRRVMSRGFRGLRQIVLGSHVGDSQGTMIVQGAYARAFAAVSIEQGFLWTTELVYAAECSGRSLAEVPVALSPRHAIHGSRVRPSDVWDMLEGLLRIRRRKTVYEGILSG